MGHYVLGFDEVDRTRVAVVGGKGAQLGELSRTRGVSVPPGFCVTTAAYQSIRATAPPVDEALDRLARLKPGQVEEIRLLSETIRRTIEATAIPADVAAEITTALARLGQHSAYAVRSSATAEDLPTASFAGLQDTYLNVVGLAAVLQHVSRCWASLFSERAVTYRLRSGFDHREVHMAVVVQRMLFPKAAGILFTADPVTSNRKVAAVEACFGLGEALVSGLVNADVFRVRDGQVVSRAIATKERALFVAPSGGTREEAIAPVRQRQPALTDAQVLQLAALGRRLEAHFGSPQDIEWCLVDEDFHVVQSRPITTLFPIPEAQDDENHVYLSVGHQQMMTDPMKPLGLSMWQLTAGRPMLEAGGRLFVDVTRELSSAAIRHVFLAAAAKSDPLTADALDTILAREGFIPSLPEEDRAAPPPRAPVTAIDPDPKVVEKLIRRNEESVAILKGKIRSRSGLMLFDFILEDIQELRRILFDPESHQVYMTAIEASQWLNENLRDWLGEKNVADELTKSVPHNITSEMGLALMHVADVIRPHVEATAFLEETKDDDFVDRLAKVPGGRPGAAAIRAFLDRYGMRGVGEIDITRPRWSERPTALLPILLGHIKNFDAGAGERLLLQGRQDAREKEREVLQRLRALPDGQERAEETKRMIDRLRTFIGYREYPKYGMVSRYFVYKQALMAEAERLVNARVLRDREDIYFLTFQELHDVVRTNRVDADLIRKRQDAFRSYQALTPPRVLTSEGEAIAGGYHRGGIPQGALPGLAVSAGTVEGRARVVLDIEKAALEPGDILVTRYTDPSWTPLFLAIRGLVTEVGGMMTHGSVIAREYGLPAVVAVADATRLIHDGQRIRVDGTEGSVQIVP